MEARRVLKESLKRRKEIDIQQHDTHHEEIDTIGLFDDEKSKEFDEVVVDLMEKNNALNEEVRNLKREQEIQTIRMCEVSEQKKKVEEEKVMIENEKRMLVNRLEERSFDV